MDKMGHEHTSGTAAAFKAEIGCLLLATFMSHHALRMASDAAHLTTTGGLVIAMTFFGQRQALQRC